jgi:hypothetical protein
MSKKALTNPDTIKTAAQDLLKSGLASYAELAAISGRNRQTVRLWSLQLGAESARQKHLEKIWREAIMRASRA